MTKNNDELMPCPFCGCDIVKSNISGDLVHPSTGCVLGAIHIIDTKAWNTRHHPKQPSDDGIQQGMAFIKNNDPVAVRVFECWSIYPNSYGEKVGLFTSPNKYNDQIADRENIDTLTRSPEHDVNETDFADIPEPVDNKQNTTTDMPDEIMVRKSNALSCDFWGTVKGTNHPDETKYIRADLASQTQVGVDMYQDAKDAVNNDVVFSPDQIMVLQNMIDYLKPPEPNTDEKRVMDLMAGALESASVCLQREECCFPEGETTLSITITKALAEYENLGGIG